MEIKILPSGKSLDVCAELREAGKLRRDPGNEGGGRKRRRRKRKLMAVDSMQDEVCFLHA